MRGETQANDVRIEVAAPTDADAIADLARRFFVEEGFDLPVEGLAWRVRRYLELDGHAIFIARRGEGAVGFATMATGFGLEYGWVAELEDLYVLAFERRQGIARDLVDRAAGWASDRGCSVVLVTVTPEGERSHTLSVFYARLGFLDRGRRLLERPLP
jgi:aminoglycoside 6'-N-acetyltransferase I